MNLENIDNYARIEINGKTVAVPNPEEIPGDKFIGRREILIRALAAWSRIDGRYPLNFRLYGPPGVGKNAIVYELARKLKKDFYWLNGHEELNPDNIAIQPAETSNRAIEYMASPLFAAMFKGGIFFFDEIDKAPVSALDPLASVLDDRRSLTSTISGIRIRAHKEFLFCAALNEEKEEGLGLPGFIDERTRPAIHVGYPPDQEMEEILKSQLPIEADIWTKTFILEFRDMRLSPRNSITLLTYAFNLYKKENEELIGRG
jgi:MoxR-like ATPase